MNDSQIIFQVNRERKTTTTTKLVADECSCGGNDLVTVIAQQSATINTLTQRLNELERRLPGIVEGIKIFDNERCVNIVTKIIIQYRSGAFKPAGRASFDSTHTNDNI